MTPTFQQRTEELAAFVAEHGRYPSVNREPGKSLGAWLTYQRSRSRDGRLSAERAATLDAAAPSWRDPRGVSDRWEERFGALSKFVAEHGKPKARAKDPHGEENRLNIWLQGQRVEDRKSPIAPERRARLDALVPGWSQARRRDASMSWEDFLTAVVAHHEQHGVWPSQVAEDPDERRKGSWLSHQRHRRNNRDKGKGLTLSDERLAALDAAAPGWEITRRTDTVWQERADSLTAFIAEHGRLPRSSERDLYQWMKAQRVSSDPDRVRWIEKVAPESMKSTAGDASWRRQADEVSALAVSAGRFPNASPAEIRLYHWLVKQRRAFETGNSSLTPERQAWLDQFLPGWRSGRLAS